MYCNFRGLLFAAAAFPLLSAETAQPTLPCATCHPRETARFLKSKMGNSIGPPQPRPDGHVTHALSGTVIDIVQRDGRMIHRVTNNGITAEYPIDYEIGDGLIGFSYLIRMGNYLFESPASWYNRTGWDVSPGFEKLPGLDATRSINLDCLFCHSGAPQFSDPDDRRLATPSLVAITCERCHGPTAEHLRRPVPGSIVNPARLSGRIRESVCAQCHLEGEARVPNPGKKSTDFHAGRNLSTVLAIYVEDQANSGANVVNHFEQLESSRCARESGGRMWCGTCHDPHGEPVDRTAQMRGICTSCHKELSKAAHPSAQTDCVACHMPHATAADVAHAAITDHRILRHPEASPIHPGDVPSAIKAWDEPPAEYRERDLAIAECLVGYQKNVRPLFDAGVSSLEKIVTTPAGNDPLTVSSLGSMLLVAGRMWGAVVQNRRAAEMEPRSADFAFNLAISLRGVGDAAGEERELKRAIELDPLLQRPYMALFGLYAEQGRRDEARNLLDSYLKLNPQSIQFRAQRAAISQ